MPTTPVCMGRCVDKATHQALVQAPSAGLWGWGVLKVDSFFTQTSCFCPQHLPHQPAWCLCIAFGRAWLVCSSSSACWSLALGCFPQECLTFRTAFPGFAWSAHIDWMLLKSLSASEIAFVRNTAAFWLPSLWSELSHRLQGVSPQHHKSHLYPFLHFPSCLLCPYTCDRDKTMSLHQWQRCTECLKERLPLVTAHTAFPLLEVVASHKKAANTLIISKTQKKTKKERKKERRKLNLQSD